MMLKPNDPCFVVGVGPCVTMHNFPGPDGPKSVTFPGPAVIEGRLVEVDEQTGRVLFMPADPKAWRAPWNKERAEVYETREAAEAALERQRHDIRSVLTAIREPGL